MAACRRWTGAHAAALRKVASGLDHPSVSHLIDLIDAYREKHGRPSEASIARAIGVEPQTVNSWRNRGIKELPAIETLKRLAAFLGVDYEQVVFRAAAMDAGWLSEPKAEAPVVGQHDAN